jgi:hypothetical protein
MNETKEIYIYYCTSRRGEGGTFASYDGSFLHLKDVM